MGNDQDGFVWPLRERVKESFDRFLRTLDAALVEEPTAETLDKLRHDANNVMRAIARVRIEIERVAEEHQDQ